MKQSVLTNLYWPDFETGMVDVEAHMVRRVTDVDVVLKHVRTKGIAVQAGGHVGMWALQLAKQFAFVHTYEPSADMFLCLRRNTDHCRNIVPHQAALGAKTSRALFTPRRAGRSKIDPTGSEYVALHMIDNLDLPRCDLLYLDIEGYEMEALAGAAATVKTFKPVIVLECLKGHEQEQADWAKSMSYQLAERIHNDRIYTPA